MICPKCGYIEVPEIHHTVNQYENIKALNEIALEGIKPRIPEGMGFAFLMFNYGDKGNLFYIASANREDMIAVMKEFIKKNEH